MVNLVSQFMMPPRYIHLGAIDALFVTFLAHVPEVYFFQMVLALLSHSILMLTGQDALILLSVALHGMIHVSWGSFNFLEM